MQRSTMLIEPLRPLRALQQCAGLLAAARQQRPANYRVPSPAESGPSAVERTREGRGAGRLPPLIPLLQLLTGAGRLPGPSSLHNSRRVQADLPPGKKGEGQQRVYGHTKLPCAKGSHQTTRQK